MKERTYTIKVRGRRYPVSKAVYKAYHQHREHERYLSSQAADQERSLERFAEEGVSVEYQYAMSRPSLEDSIFDRYQIEALRTCITQLSDAERQLISALFVQGRSQRETGLLMGLSQQAVSKRKQALLVKLKNILEN